MSLVTFAACHQSPFLLRSGHNYAFLLILRHHPPLTLPPPPPTFFSHPETCNCGRRVINFGQHYFQYRCCCCWWWWNGWAQIGIGLLCLCRTKLLLGTSAHTAQSSTNCNPEAINTISTIHNSIISATIHSTQFTRSGWVGDADDDDDGRWLPPLLARLFEGRPPTPIDRNPHPHMVLLSSPRLKICCVCFRCRSRIWNQQKRQFN